MKKIFSLFTCVLLFHIHLVNAQNSPGYHIDKISLEGDGGWDYLAVDDFTGRLFVSHGTMVQVVDVSQKKVIAVIPDLKGVHGIALANDINKGFISEGRDSSVTVFNLRTYAVIKKIKVTGRNPDAILYDPFSHRVFTFNGGSSNATVIDARTDQVIGTIALEGKPEFSVSDGKGKIYVNIEDKSKVNVINPVTLKVEQQWPVAPGEEPSGLAFDKENQRLFIVCDNKLMVIMDAQSGKIVATVPIGGRVDGVAFDPEKKRAYSSNGDGTLTVVQEENENSFKVLENVPTQKSARTIAIDKKTHHVFLPAAEYGSTPEPTAENPHPRPPVKPGTFVVLDIEPVR